MSLRERLGRLDEKSTKRLWYRKYGVWNNPFPSAEQTFGHPRLEDDADDRIADSFRQFDGHERPSQVLVVEGTQGVGKTNLLNYYEEQFQDVYRSEEGMYIIRYHPDLEPSFDAVVRKVFQSLDQAHFERIGRALAELDDSERTRAKEIATGHEVKLVLNSLERAGREGEGLEHCARLAMQWFVGLRILKAHRETLGVDFRLDTVESRTRALRDVVYVSESLGLLKGIILLLDELEKQDYSLSKTSLLRFFFAIRALIDSLPQFLFLMLAMTVDARRKYFAMLPAMASRLQTIVALPPIQSGNTAEKLYGFYVQEERRTARRREETNDLSAGLEPLFSDTEISDVFGRLSKRAEATGSEGVTPREFLHSLHHEWEDRAR